MRRVRRLLAAEGLTEMVTLSLVDPESNRLLDGAVSASGAEPVRAGEPAVVAS